MTVRHAGTTDLTSLASMLVELFGIERDFTPDPGAHIRGLSLVLRDPSYRLLVAPDDDDRPIGMLSLHVLISTALGGKVGLVEDVFVQPLWRRRGVGRALCGAAERIACEENLLRLSLLADSDNTSALAFYERLGWSRTSLVALQLVSSSESSSVPS